MANEINIVVKSQDKTGPGFKAAKKAMAEVGQAAATASKDVDKLGDESAAASSDTQSLGDKAKSSASDVDKLGSSSSRTAKESKGLGDKAKSSASDVDKLGDESAAASKDIDKAAKSAESAESSFGKMAAGATVAAGSVGAIGEAFSQGFSADKAEGALAAKLGLNDEDAIRVGKIQGELYSNAYGESMDELSDVTSSAIRAMGGDLASISDSEIKGLTTDLVNIGTAFEIGFEESSDAVRGMLTNDLVGSAEEAGDVLTKALQIDGSGDIVDTFREYGSELQQMGFTAEEFLSVANAGLGAGARNTDLIADAFKEANIILQEGTKDSANALSAMGLDAKQVQKDIAAGGPTAKKAFGQVTKALSEIDDEHRKNAAGVAIFGTKYEDLSSDIVDAMGQASGSFGGLEDASEKLDKNINDNVGTAMETLKRQVSTGLGKALGPIVSKLANKMKTIDFEAVGAKVEEVIGKIVPIIEKIGRIIIDYVVPAIGGLVEVFSRLAEHKDILAAIGIGVAAVLVPAFVAWGVSAAVAAAATIAAAAPLLLIGAAVAALAYLIIKNWDSIKAATSVVWGAISAAIKAVWGVIKAIIKVAISAIKGYIKVQVAVIKGYWWVLKNTFKVLWAAIKAIIKVVIGAVVLYIKAQIAIIKAVWAALKVYLSAMWWAIKAVISIVVDVIVAVVDAAVWILKKIWKGLEIVAKNVWNGILWVIDNTIGAAWRNVKKVIGWIRSIWYDVSDAASHVWTWVGNKISDTMSWVWGIVTDKINAIVEKINWVKDKLAGLGNGVKDKLSNISIPGFADGGTSSGGLAVVGERGPELRNLKPGEKINSYATSQAMQRGGTSQGGGIVINVHGSVVSERELVSVIKDALMNGAFDGLR